LNFHQLHQALQVTFGWATTHLYKFEVLDPAPANRSRFDVTKVHLALEENPEPPMNFGPGAGPAFLAMQMQEAAKSKEVGLWTVLEDP